MVLVLTLVGLTIAAVSSSVVHSSAPQSLTPWDRFVEWLNLINCPLDFLDFERLGEADVDKIAEAAEADIDDVREGALVVPPSTFEAILEKLLLLSVLGLLSQV